MAGKTKRWTGAQPQPNNCVIIFFFVVPVIVAIYALVTATFMHRRENSPPSGTPKVLVVDGHTGPSGVIVNGEYLLELSLVHGRPAWARRQRAVAGASLAFIIYSQCGEWLISQHPKGHLANCSGYVLATGCGTEGVGSGPWDCTGQWRKWSREGPISESLAVTVELGPPALAKCSRSEEEALYKAVRDIDLVLPWINGSDPAWLQRRARVCEDFFGQLWDDAVHWSPRARACLQDAAANKSQPGLCGPGGECGKDSADSGSLPAAGSAECFQQYLREQCGSRLLSIKDHDELRYLVRSVERNLRWHTGRILLVTPRGQRPSWLQAKGRLQHVFQEDLLQAAMKAGDFVAPETRPAYAPDRIFNDEAILAALPFLPNASRFVLLMDDDLFLPRLVAACELFTRPPRAGVRLFGRTLVPANLSDPYAQVHAAREAWTAKIWGDRGQAQGGARVRAHAAAGWSPYYQTQHAPWVLDTEVLRDLWNRWPRLMSAAVDSPFRHPNLTDVVGLHHSELALAGREARLKAARSGVLGRAWSWLRRRAFDEGDVAGRSRVEDADNHGQTIVKEALIRTGTAEEWQDVVSTFRAIGVVPAVYSIQDDSSGAVTQEQACLREQWVSRLVPHRSSWESPDSPPTACSGR